MSVGVDQMKFQPKRVAGGENQWISGLVLHCRKGNTSTVVRPRRLLRRAAGSQSEGGSGKKETEGSSKGHGQESKGVRGGSIGLHPHLWTSAAVVCAFFDYFLQP